MKASSATQGTRNAVQTGVLLAGMAALLAAVGWGLAGAEGVVMALAAGLGVLVFAPDVSGRLVMQALGARRLDRDEAPVVHRVLDSVSRRAGLPAPPALYYLPDASPQAFTIGQRSETAAICLSGGLLRLLGGRELAAVLAHEIAHLLHHDLKVMMLADMITRLTRAMSFAGISLLLFSGMAYAAGQPGAVPWWLTGVLLLAPTASALMQLALSRTREFEADRLAARLTGDPLGLAAALTLLESRSRGFWERFLGGSRPEPSLLRTHPRVEERVRRLKDISSDYTILDERVSVERTPLIGAASATVRRPPRWLWWWR